MAEAAALSRYHFARSFRSEMGVPPVTYLWRRRAQLAASKLSETTRSLAEVALSCGFSDQSHFTTVFRREHGVTPAAFRRALLALIVSLFSAGSEAAPMLGLAA